MRQLICLLFCVLSACSSPTASISPPEKSLPRPQLVRNAMRAAVWQFVYCLQAGQDSSQLVNLLEEIAREEPFGKRIEVLSCNELTSIIRRERSFTLFGNRLPAPAPQAPITAQRLLERYDLATDDVVFVPYYRNPWSAGKAVTAFYWAQRPDRLVETLRSELAESWDALFWPRWAYEIHRGNGDRIYGSFKDRDSTWSFDFTREVALQAPEKPVFVQDGLRIFAYDGVVPTAATDSLATTLKKVRSWIAPRTEDALATWPEVRVYPNLERIGLRSGKMDPVQYDSAKHLLHIVPTVIKMDDLLLSFPLWCALTPQSSPSPSLSTLVRWQQQASKQIGAPYARRILEARRIARTGILQLPPANSPIIEEARLRLSIADTTAIPLTRPQPASVPSDKLAGMTFAHEGYRVHNGYGGEKIVPALDSLAELAVNALAIVPYTFMRRPDVPISLPIPQRAGSENDWATRRSIREARQRNWFVLLKPQIWLGGGHWPGSINFEKEEDWAAFFEHYRYWILHYALLAEREGVQGLCVGTELVQTTLRYPERWQAIIAAVRQVYGGTVTYAANWGEEFEQCAFRDALDALGLNAYYPLTDGEEATDAELLRGAHRWLEMAVATSRQAQRPLWLTEVGYRSVAAAWQQPHAEAGERAASGRDQARCYRALWTAAADYPELQATFVWKWPSYLGYADGRRDQRRFTPGGKPAANELRAFYEQWTQ